MADTSEDNDLPQVWPFTFAGLLVVAGLSWFCLGFALDDVGKELPAHYQVFWGCILAAVILIVGGGIMATVASRRRRDQLGLG